MTRTAVLTGAIVALALPPFAEASCILMTPAQQRVRAKVIFEGAALESATATGVQRFRVTRYLKGAGPKLVRVATGEVSDAGGGGGLVTSVSIHVVRGEKWRIFSRGSAQRVLRTSVCDGSKRLGGIDRDAETACGLAGAQERSGLRLGADGTAHLLRSIGGRLRDRFRSFSGQVSV